MKKLIAWMLAFCMVFQLAGMPVYASDVSAGGVPEADNLLDEAENGQGELPEVVPPETPVVPEVPESVPTVPEGADKPDAAETPAPTEESKAVKEKDGNLNISILFTLPIENAQDAVGSLKAELAGEGLTKDGSFILSEAEGIVKKASASVSGLKTGTYQLTVSGSKFETYHQEITIEAMDQQIRLTNSYKDSSVNGEKHPGIIGYGDVTRDGIIDQADEDTLTAAISANNNDVSCDLNGDGKVNIIDLQYYSYNLGYSPVQSFVTRTYSADNMVANHTGTLADGSSGIDSILTDEGVVTIAPADGAAISAENPVEVSIDLSGRDDVKAGGFTIVPPKNSDNIIQDGEIMITYLDESGKEAEMLVPISAGNTRTRAATAASVTQEPDGTLVVNLGGQIAIKKVTIKVTKTGSDKLADIAKVEFLNDMEDRIPAPEMNIPDQLKVIPGDKQFTVTWSSQPNVTGYEVVVSNNGMSKVQQTTKNTMLVKSFNNEKLVNKEKYEVKVRSVNGEWNSGYSDPVIAIPMPEKAPDAPENVTITGGYSRLSISWKKMKDTDYYTLYYRIKGEQEYQKITEIKEPKYELTGLKDKAEYEIYLTGTNDIGTSGNSQTYIGRTMDLDPAITSNYKLINTANGIGNATAHIKGVEYPASTPSKNIAVADYDYSTSWELGSWDAGGFNKGKPSPIISFDQPYEMDRIVVVPSDGQKYTYGYAKTRYWDQNGKETMIDGQFSLKKSSNGKPYYEFNYDKPFTTDKIQINFALGYAHGDGKISIAEMKFYNYDSLEQEVAALYRDELQVSLVEGTTIEMIETLEKRANTPDEVSGDYHPRRELILKELENARKLLNDESLKKPLQIDPTVTKAKDGALGFSGGLNAWQPLGVTVHEGEEIAVYVGSADAAIGANSKVRLIATQYHAESGTWNTTVLNDLKIGKNVVTIPAIGNLDVEHGGSLYVEYTGNTDNSKLGVRVSGGADIPMLNIAKAGSEQAKKDAIRTYIQELNEYVPKMKSEHDKLHKGVAESNCNYNYDAKNCILGATDIVLNQMMYSVSSEQVLKGINSKVTSQNKEINLDNQTEIFYQSLEAMNQMLTLFYQHKGLANYGADMVKLYGDKNNLPSSRLNIRYMRMFAGAFMYAGGLHVGIEWDSVTGLTGSEPIVSDNGKYQSGNLFGWGIAHEIGHIINQPSYTIAEITNNYFSILAQADETNGKVRFQYPKVYEKVTSNTKGRSDDVFTSLAMYWQLHLAYDNGYNYKTYNNYDEQFKNLFFARVDAYARNLSLAPKPKGIALTLPKDVDNTLMRLACAAAEKNLLAFFDRWGMTADKETIAYAEQFEAESRSIYYITDVARSYRVEQGKDVATGTKVQAVLKHEANTNQVTLRLTNDSADAGAMLGYEIYRNGKVVGFVSAEQGETEFTDTVSTLNNRVLSYEVIGYDKLLNKTAKTALDPIKLSNDGSVAKNSWSVTTNMVSEDDKMEEGSIDNPEPSAISAIKAIHNNDYKDQYIGTAKEPEIVVSLGEVLAVTGIKVTADPKGDAIKDYEVYVSQDKVNWTLAKKGTLSYEDGVAREYFNKADDFWLYTYDAAYMKIAAKNQGSVAMSELDILGPSGDNVELVENGIGILKKDFAYDKEGGIIPKGSLIFTGEYKGNPAYNVVKLYNQNNEIIEGSQIIFAKVPEKGELGEISSGTWIYYIEPSEDGSIPEDITSVRAELYRVDDAHTNEGERLVSDALPIAVPEVLPEIELTNQMLPE